MTTFIFSKKGDETVIVEANLAPLLVVPGSPQIRKITNIELQPAAPATRPPLAGSVISGISADCKIQLSGGIDGIDYGMKMLVTTDIDVIPITIAVSVVEQPWIPYVAQNPDAFQDLVGEVQAGNSEVATAVFMFPPEMDARGGNITWELLNDQGEIYASGNAYDYEIVQNGLQTRVLGHCIIHVPTDIPPTLLDQRYELRYTLELPPISDEPAAQRTFYSFEYIQVVGLNTVPLGVQPSVELKGGPATMELVTARLYDNVTLQIEQEGTILAGPFNVVDPVRVADGFYWSAVTDTEAFPVSLVPYNLVWKYWDSANPAKVFQEYADFWVINPSIASAIRDVQAKIWKAHNTLYGTPDLFFPDSVVLTWLRRGMDMFNGYMGVFTSFTMTNAKGSIREYWLLCAEVAALESQYLAEGNKSFNFGGQAISLDVDQSQYYDNLASKIKGQLDNELKPFKVNLVTKGNTCGDGSADPSKLRAGAIGAVGITISAASSWGRFLPAYPANIGRAMKGG